jgi:hypothetical protein
MAVLEGTLPLLWAFAVPFRTLLRISALPLSRRLLYETVIRHRLLYDLSSEIENYIALYWKTVNLIKNGFMQPN